MCTHSFCVLILAFGGYLSAISSDRLPGVCPVHSFLLRLRSDPAFGGYFLCMSAVSSDRLSEVCPVHSLLVRSDTAVCWLPLLSVSLLYPGIVRLRYVMCTHSLCVLIPPFAGYLRCLSLCYILGSSV